MSYLAQLKEKIGNTTLQTGTDKTDRSPFVGSVSAVPALWAGNSAAQATGWASPRVELLCLITAVGTLYAFTPAEMSEATQIAFADPRAALDSYRDIARRYGLNVPTDNRVTCGECLRLVKGHCQAAKMGMMKDTQLDYSPGDVDIPRRCASFVLKAQ